MAHLVSDTIGGYNRFIEDQKKVDGTASVSLVQFDTTVKPIYTGVDIREVKNLDENGYRPQGWTALLDAMGETIQSIGLRLSKLNEEDRPDRVVVVTMTDGEENSSREFTAARISDMIKLQSEVYKWQFVYLGANQDSFLVGKSLNIPKVSTTNWDATPIGTRVAYMNISDGLTKYRQGMTNSVDLSNLTGATI
jgi:hypothetical protein